MFCVLGSLDSMPTHIADNIMAVRERIASAAQRAGRSIDDITLVAVTKTHAPASVEAALAAGIQDCGENRVQEAEEKIASLPDGAARWHLLGQLQRNKARRAAALFDLVHSVDSVRLAEALNHAADGDPSRRQGRLPVLLEINVAGEASKAGFRVAQGSDNRAASGELQAAVERIAALPFLSVKGLMTVAPYVEDAEQVRWVFASLRRLRDDMRGKIAGLELPHLSMGMSDDFEVAIEEGATIVRVGRAIFGQRSTNKRE